MNDRSVTLRAMGVDDVSSSDTLAGESASEATVVVPDLTPMQAADLAWTQADEPPLAEPRRPLPRALKVLLAGVCVAALALGAFVLGQHRRQPEPVKPSAAPVVPKPSPPRPLLSGAYRIDHDWEHQTYRGNQTRNGGVVRWNHDGIPDSEWWAFVSMCNDAECVATGVHLDDKDHQGLAVPSAADALRLVNGVWRDTTPYRYESDCTYISSGAPAGKDLRATGWVFEPLADGSFHGSITTSSETDGCGDKGDTLVVPITATRVGDVPAGVLTALP